MIRIIREKQLNDTRTNYCDMLFCEAIKKYNEKIYELEEDVDIIYDTFFRNHVDAFQNTGKLPPMITYGTMYSDELFCETSQLADQINSIIIECGGNAENTYNSIKKKITLSFNPDAIKALSKLDTYSDIVQKKIVSEISEDSIKSAIVHELSHWIRDSLNNNYLYNLVVDTKDFDRNDPKQMKKLQGIWGRRKDITASHFEIDAQVHGIKQIKDLHTDWDVLTLLEDLFFLYPSLMEIGRLLYKEFSPTAYTKWIKDLVKRMARENILGKSMVEFPSPLLFEHREVTAL